jgi:hypothetical protein
VDPKNQLLPPAKAGQVLQGGELFDYTVIAIRLPKSIRMAEKQSFYLLFLFISIFF